MDPEGRIRTGISVVDSDALYRLSYLGVVPEVYPRDDLIARWPKGTALASARWVAPASSRLTPQTTRPAGKAGRVKVKWIANPRTADNRRRRYQGPTANSTPAHPRFDARRARSPTAQSAQEDAAGNNMAHKAS